MIRKLTNRIRQSIASQYNSEMRELLYTSSINEYIINTPPELTALLEKYPFAFRTYRRNDTEGLYLVYSEKGYCSNTEDVFTPTLLSLESLSTFDDVKEALPHLTKYLPC
jgi:hypothetical protein